MHRDGLLWILICIRPVPGPGMMQHIYNDVAQPWPAATQLRRALGRLDGSPCEWCKNVLRVTLHRTAKGFIIPGKVSRRRTLLYHRSRPSIMFLRRAEQSGKLPCGEIWGLSWHACGLTHPDFPCSWPAGCAARGTKWVQLQRVLSMRRGASETLTIALYRRAAYVGSLARGVPLWQLVTLARPVWTDRDDKHPVVSVSASFKC